MYRAHENYNNDAKEFWETCDTTFAHLTVDRWLEDTESLAKTWEENFLSHLNLSNERVIDYGIGGGHLGQYLLSNKNIAHYSGIDISERSLKTAENNLSKFSNKDFHLTPIDFSSLGATTFISIACIQHFESLSYVEDFFENLRKAEFNQIALQVRMSPVVNFIKNSPIYSCWLNFDYLAKSLPGYKLTHFSKLHPNKYQYFVFSKKPESKDLSEEFKKVEQDQLNQLLMDSIDLSRRNEKLGVMLSKKQAEAKVLEESEKNLKRDLKKTYDYRLKRKLKNIFKFKLR